MVPIALVALESPLLDEESDSSPQADRTSIAANDSIIAYLHVLIFTPVFKPILPNISRQKFHVHNIS
jgi:hypothetical protein